MRPLIYKDLFAAMRSASDIQLAAWSCTFNSWGYPEELAEFKPSWWDMEEIRELKDLKHEYISPVQDFIERRIGDKFVSRYHNRERMTDEEFEMFWYHKEEYYEAKEAKL